MYQKSAWLGALVLSLLAGSPLFAGVIEPEDDDAVLRDYYSANGLANRGLHELAVAEYRKFLEHHGGHKKAPTARYGLAVCLYRLEKYDEAALELTSLRQQPDTPYAAEVGTVLGQCRLAQGKYRQAAQLFDEVVQHFGTHDLADDAAAGAAEALYLDGQYEDAVAKCRLLAARWPDSPLGERIRFFWGLAAMGQHDYRDAAEQFSKLLRDFPSGPFADQASLLVAKCYHHDGLIEQAVRQYRALLGRPQTQHLPDALLGLGVLALQQGRVQESGELLDQLIANHPESPLVPTASFHRGRTWYEQGEWDRALALFQQCAPPLKDSPLEDDAAYWAAKCRLRQEHFRDVVERLDGALEAFPASELLAEMHYDRAVALIRSGDHDRGIEALQEFRQHFVKHALAANALHLLATTRHDQRRYDLSQAYCREFLEAYPSHELAAGIAFLSAENHILSREYGEAAAAYRRFLSQYPNKAQSTSARYRLGTALYRLGQYEEAHRLLTEFVEQAKTDERFRFAWLVLGDIHFQRGEWKQAQRFLGDYLSSGEGVVSADDALLKLGLARQRQGHHQEALNAFERLIQECKESPHHLQAVFEQGQTLVALGRFDDATKAFEQVLAEGGECRFKPFALNHLGALAMRRQDFNAAAKLYEDVAANNGQGMDEAESLFQRGQALLASGQLGEADAAFAKLLDKYPAHDRAAMAHVQRLIALSRQEQCLDALDMVGQIERGVIGKLDPTGRASVGYEKAWCLRELGRDEEATQAYRRLLSAAPPEDIRIYALLDLATLEVRTKQYESAAKLLRQLKQAIANTSSAVPDDVREPLTYQLAVCEYELGRFQAATELFEEFITRFPDSPQLASASFFCGESLYKMNQPAPATTHLTRVVDNFPSDPVYPPALLRLGECLSVLQRWPRAEQAFNEYLDRNGDGDQWFQAQFGLGWTRENQGRYDEAIRAYRKVVERHKGPTAARAQFQIGECLYARKNYADAARELLKVDILYAYPEWSAAALYEAGQCFEKLAKYVEARAQFKTVAEKFPETRWAEMASKRLADLASAALPGR